MKTVVLGEPPVEFAKMIANRRAVGADLYDEVWEGDYHMAPAPNAAHGDVDTQLAVLLHPLAKRAGLFSTSAVNVGELDNLRVPDRALHRIRPSGVWVPTVAVAVEVVSPYDETWDKLAFYAEHNVDELLIVDPSKREVTWLGLSVGGYEPIGRSRLGVTADELAAQIDWPPID